MAKNKLGTGCIKTYGYTFYNYCGHPIVVKRKDGTTLTIQPKNGQLVRLPVESADADFAGFKLRELISLEPLQLPPPEENVFYIVSSIILYTNMYERPDLLAPIMLEVDRRTGTILRCKGFMKSYGPRSPKEEEKEIDPYKPIRSMNWIERLKFFVTGKVPDKPLVGGEEKNGS